MGTWGILVIPVSASNAAMEVQNGLVAGMLGTRPTSDLAMFHSQHQLSRTVIDIPWQLEMFCYNVAAIAASLMC